MSPDLQIKQLVKVFHEANKREFLLFALKDEALVEPLLEAMVKCTVAGGQVYVVETSDEGIVGAGLWFGPGQISLGSLQLGSSLHNIPDSYYGKGGQEAAYHLQLFAVLPTCQKKGYGKALMRHVEDKAKSEGADVVLQTVGDKNSFAC
ncbi:hypothetical protein VNI00_000405 [Paramarasmius palmivorus]|uniref:N-acetyltransferase domain-containing protein n=1 Tax=Paramarasmius palmivorus TaxID=297713 RepID=A0AAW0EEK2_9AGAR